MRSDTRLKATLFAFFAASLLAACGGGGDSAAHDQKAQPASATQETDCTISPVSGGQVVAHLSIAQDIYTFPIQFGLQDRNFGPLSYTNTARTAKTLQVAVKSSRRLQTPTGLVNTTPLLTFIGAVDVTANQQANVAAPGCLMRTNDLGPGADFTALESIVFNVSVPSGHTIEFTSHARVIPQVGTTGQTALTTSGLDFSVTEL